MAANAPNEIEEVIKQLKSKPGFDSYILMNNDGIVIKHENIEYKEAVMHAYHVLSLFGRTKKHIQKLFPDPTENEIDWLRLRTRLHEMIIAQHLRFTLVAVQKAEATDPAADALDGAGVAALAAGGAAVGAGGAEGKDKEEDKGAAAGATI